VVISSRLCSWRDQTVVLGPSADSPWVLELVVSCLASLCSSHGRSGRSFHNCSMESRWLESVVLASLVPTVAVGKENGCTTVAAGIVSVGTMGDCPSTAVEVNATALPMGYTPCGALEEYR
jgi:hypothetical protein